MAKIISPVWSIIRGSIAGTTYLTLPSGQIIARQRTRPTQPVSPWRTTIKNAFTESVADWASLTYLQQLDWQSWAAAHTGRSGRHEMIAAKTLLRYCSELPLPTAPVIIAWDTKPEFTVGPSFSLTLAPPLLPLTTGINVAIKNTSPVAVYFMIEVSQGFGHQRNFWKGPWDVSKSVGKAAAAGATVNQDIVCGVVGDRVFVRVRGVTNDNVAHFKGHVVTVAQITFGTVATTP